MALTKATQNVIETNICTTDTTQTITGTKTFSNISGNASSATALATGSTTARTLANRFADVVNVLDFGADPTGAASSVSAFNSALLQGGTIYVPKGTYKLDGKVELTVDSTTLLIGADVTLLLSNVPATQVPFGNQIHVIADNCSIIGSGSSTLLQMSGTSQANAVGLFHHSGFTIRDLIIDGNKNNVTAIPDDTFESGISIVVASILNDANAIIDNIEIRNFVQYGINIYGGKANCVRISNCIIHDNGKISEHPTSVGTGIVVTKNVFSQIVTNNVVYNNKSNGIIFSSAGNTGGDYVVSNNLCYSNGYNGIFFYEDPSYGSVPGQGLRNIAVTGNVSTNNTRAGIEFNATNGFLRNATITGNVCTNNTYGLLVLGQVSPIVVQDINISNNDLKNNGTNVSINNANNVEGVKISFTPAIEGTTTAGTATYVTRSGSFVRNGSIVTFEFEVTWTGHTGTGDIKIIGLPYAGDSNEPQSIGWVSSNNLTITGQSYILIVASQDYGLLYSSNNGTSAAVTIDAAASLRCSGSYFVN